MSIQRLLYYLISGCKPVTILLTLPLPLFGQQLQEMVSIYRNTYKDSDAIILSSETAFEFEYDEHGVTVKETRDQQLLALRFNTAIDESEFYDSHSEIKQFFCVSSLNQRSMEEDKVCGKYTNSDYFFDDNKVCSHTLKLKEPGEVWKTHMHKVYKDTKYLTSVYFHDKYPIAQKTITLKLPPELEVDIHEFNFEEFGVQKRVTEDEDGKVIEYSVQNISAMVDERLSRGIQYVYPHLLLCVKSFFYEGKKVTILSGLNDLYKWYRSLTLQLSVRPEVFGPQVDQLLLGKETEEEKISAIYYWVQDNIRYIAFENGLAGFKPDDAHVVYLKKYGDCKGMANLTREMLRYAGFDARLSWVGTKHIRYDYSIPSLASDNHMICTVLLNGKKYFLDATEKYLPLGVYAERIQGRQVMIEDGDNYILDRIPEESKEGEVELRKVFFEVNGDKLVGRYQYLCKGEKKRNFLCAYHFSSPEDRERMIRHCLVAESTTMKIKNVELSDLTNRNGPLEITAGLECTGSVNVFGNEVYIDLELFRDFKSWEIPLSRHSDIDFGEKIFKVLEVELELREVDSVIFLPEKFDVRGKDFSIYASYREEPGKIIYRREISIDKGIIQREAFTHWNDTIRKLSFYYGSPVILKRN